MTGEGPIDTNKNNQSSRKHDLHRRENDFSIFIVRKKRLRDMVTVSTCKTDFCKAWTSSLYGIHAVSRHRIKLE